MASAGKVVPLWFALFWFSFDFEGLVVHHNAWTIERLVRYLCTILFMGCRSFSKKSYQRKGRANKLFYFVVEMKYRKCKRYQWRPRVVPTNTALRNAKWVAQPCATVWRCLGCMCRTPACFITETLLDNMQMNYACVRALVKESQEILEVCCVRSTSNYCGHDNLDVTN